MHTIRCTLLICLVSLVAAADASAQLPRGVAWARVTNDGTVVAQSYSSTGGAVSATKRSTGAYYVKFANNNMFGGVGHAVALGGNRYCSISRARDFIADMTVDVYCYSPNGQRATSDFVVLFYKEQRSTTDWNSAYVFADQATAASYTPAVQWHSRGGTITAAQGAVGEYGLSMPALRALRMNYFVTAFDSNAHCWISTTGGSADITHLGIRCEGPDGVAVNAPFVVSIINDFAVGREKPSEQRRGAYLRNNDFLSAEVTPSPRNQLTLATAPLTTRRLAQGEYEVDVPEIAPATSVALVMSEDDEMYCSVSAQRAGPAGGMVVPVSCHAVDGASADGVFLLTILSSELATAPLPPGDGPIRATAWVRVELGEPPTADLRYQYNPTGEMNTVADVATDVFRVRFPGLATVGGIVHVNSNSDGYCKAASWGPVGTALDVFVMCFSDTGAFSPRPFTVLFYKEDRGAAGSLAAYARAMIGNADVAYAAPTPYAWSGFGPAVQITRTGVGQYGVRFGPDTTMPYLQVITSSYGSAAIHCKGFLASAGQAAVMCFNTSGQYADSDFGISIFGDLGFGADPSGPATTGAYTLSRISTGTYLPDFGVWKNSTGGGVRITHPTDGSFLVDLPGLKPSNRSMALVIANGDSNRMGSVHCQPLGVTATPAGGGARVEVSCLAFGSPVDDVFTLVYLTDQGNGAPQISAIADRTVASGESTGVIAFTVSDDTNPAAVTITATSNLPPVVPVSNILMSGTGANRTLTVVTEPRQIGKARITLTARDEHGFTSSRTFTITSTLPRTLTVAPTGMGAGTVTSAPAGVDCGLTCAATFADASTVTLTAVPRAGSTFLGWTGAACPGTATCVVTMDAAKTVTATFGLPPKTYYLAEGATGSFFDLDIVIANPNDVDVPVEMTFLDASGHTYPLNVTLGAKRTRTVAVETEVPALANADVSTIVTSPTGAPLVVERSLFWDQSYYGGHTGSAVDGPQTTWYFGEGFQAAPVFDTFILLANANNAPAHVTLTFLRQGSTPVTATKTIAATSRANVWAAELPAELNGQAFSTVVTSDLPIIAERAMYFGTPAFNGGHESAGVAAPSTSWFHAEGRTGPFFDTYILIGNPGDTPANVTVRFLRANDTPITTTVTVAAQGRETIYVDGIAGLPNTDVSTEVTSDVPVISERSMYWPGDFAEWYEAHNSFGVTSTGLAWGLAEGRFGFTPQFETYILLTNPTATPTRVRVTFLRQGSKAPIVSEQLLGANARANVDMSALQNAPDYDATGERFGALVESLDTVGIVVERALYFTSGGVFWAGGTNAAAVKIR